MLKQIIASIISLFLFISMFSTVSAQDNKEIISHRVGDADGNSKITSADARLALRYSANLEDLSEKSINAINLFNKSPDASCARKILRAAANLEALEAKIKIKTNQTYIINSLLSVGKYFWTYTITPIDTNGNAEDVITEVSSYFDEQILGPYSHQTISFKGTKTGSYRVDFILSNGSKTDIQDSFSFILECY